MGERYLSIAVFGPRIDGDFFPTDVGHLIMDAPPKTTLLGLVEEESAFFSKAFSTVQGSLPGSVPYNALAVFPPPSIGRLLALSPEKQTSFGAEDFERFVAKEVGTKETFGANLELVRKKIVDFSTQADNATEVKDAAFYVRRYTEVRKRKG